MQLSIRAENCFAALLAIIFITSINPGECMTYQFARFQRSAVAVAVGMLLSSVAYAQSSEGTIYGRGKPGDKVTITSVDSGSARQITIDANGAFTAAKLPPGAYHVV